MDHRFGSRIAAQVMVTLDRNGHHLGVYKTRDISATGLFIETDSLDLHLGALVDLTFVFKDKQKETKKFRGMLVRYTFEGAAFILNNSVIEILPYLEQSNTEALEVKSQKHEIYAESYKLQSK